MWSVPSRAITNINLLFTCLFPNASPSALTNVPTTSELKGENWSISFQTLSFPLITYSSLGWIHRREFWWLFGFEGRGTKSGFGSRGLRLDSIRPRSLGWLAHFPFVPLSIGQPSCSPRGGEDLITSTIHKYPYSTLLSVVDICGNKSYGSGSLGTGTQNQKYKLIKPRYTASDKYIEHPEWNNARCGWFVPTFRRRCELPC